MKIYIAGPMSGHENLNFDAFDRAKQGLLLSGHIPISPADIDRVFEGWDKYPSEDYAPTKADLIKIMRRDLAAIDECGAIYMLRGWKDSPGAINELAHARFLGLEIIHQD
jgi:hypothetical protein